MRICMIGWYGTETIGDRAIIAGLISIFTKIKEDIEFFIGSLYPFYSERMLHEDLPFYNEITGKNNNVTIFNSSKKNILEENIYKSDIVIIAGGPLMDLDELFMLKYGLSYAKEKGKRTGIIGCGIGPLYIEKYQKCVLDIFRLADVIILRDKQSKDNIINLSKQYSRMIDINIINNSFDPAVECCIKYNECYPKKDMYIRKYIAINFRDFPIQYANKGINIEKINRYFREILVDICLNHHMDIYMIPMHYFCIGNDDRIFLNKLKFAINNDNIIVQNRPLSLKDTMDVFSSANFTLGMRFHSVVLQTMLNGSNYILDYTAKKSGKINGFINDIDTTGFYTDRMINLQDDNIKKINFTSNSKFDNKMIELYYYKGIQIYLDVIRRKLLNV